MIGVSRRIAVAGIGSLIPELGSRSLPAQPAEGLGPDRLVLLGVRGGPLVTGYASTPSATLIVFRGAPLIIDAGYGVTLKLIDAGIPLRALRNIFITHHHSDHNLELGPLLYNAWTAGLTHSVDVYGPGGLADLLRAYWMSNRIDLEARIADEQRPDLRRLVRAHEFREGPVMSAGDVVVSALRNHHPPITDSYALKFRLGARTVVFSGDTRRSRRSAKSVSAHGGCSNDPAGPGREAEGGCDPLGNSRAPLPAEPPAPEWRCRLAQSTGGSYIQLGYTEVEMARTTIFYSNRSQAVRLPKDVAFPDGVSSVVILRDGRRRIIVPADRVWDDFFDEPGVDLGARDQPPIEERERF